MSSQESLPLFDPPEVAEHAAPANVASPHPNPYADNERRAAERAQTADERGSQTGAEQTGFHPQYVESATAAVDPPRPKRGSGRRPASTRAEMTPEEARAQDMGYYLYEFGLTGPIDPSATDQARLERGAALFRDEVSKVVTTDPDPIRAKALERALARRRNR